MPSVNRAMLARRGRPRKFADPSRAVTVTLPEHVIGALAAVDPDLGRAIVRLVQAPHPGRPADAQAEVSASGRHGVILVRQSRALERHAGVTLVPLPDGRALISFDERTTIPELELHLQDLLDEPALPAEDHSMVAQISRILRDARRSAGVNVCRRNIIVLETVSTPRRRPPAGAASPKDPRRITS